MWRLRDVEAGTTSLLAESDDTEIRGWPIVSDDGRRVAATMHGPVDLGGGPVTADVVRVADRIDKTVVTLGPQSGPPHSLASLIGLSPDGTRVVIWDGGIGVVPPGANGAVLTLATVPRADRPVVVGAGAVPVVPHRLLDTRSAFGYSGPKPTAGQVISVTVAGPGTTAPDDTAAVLLNVTATDATADGYVTVWPCGTERPTASNLNVLAGETIPNLVAVPVGVGGTVCLFTQSGTHLVADLAAWYPPSATFRPVIPERLLDTRTGAGYTGPQPTAGQTLELTIAGAGRSAIPVDASAVVFNITGTEASADGYVTVWPCGAPRPVASNLNLSRQGTQPNLVAVGLGNGGKVCVYTQSGAHLVADLAGWYPRGSTFTPLVPERLLDTRIGVGYTGAKPRAAQIVEVQARSALRPAATSVVLNVTGTEATTDGYVTVWPCGTARPIASNLNLVANQTAPNLVVVALGSDDKVCLYTQSGAHLVVDLAGYNP